MIGLSVGELRQHIAGLPDDAEVWAKDDLERGYEVMATIGAENISSPEGRVRLWLEVEP